MYGVLSISQKRLSFNSLFEAWENSNLTDIATQLEGYL